jgi:hypothetical protein
VAELAADDGDGLGLCGTVVDDSLEPVPCGAAFEVVASPL